MKKKYRLGILATFAFVITMIGLMFYGLVLMAEEDKHVDLTDLKPELHDGDIIFQSSKSSQSKAIQLATKSKYSHMGIIYKMNNETYVFEAIQPVKMTLLSDWINRGQKGHFVVKRLKNSEKLLTPNVSLKMKKVGNRFIGKDYDIYFEWSDDKIYCSELVWKIYKEAANIEIGKLERLENFDLSSKVVKKMLVKKYGDRIPMKETVISPKAMFESEKLETIYKE